MSMVKGLPPGQKYKVTCAAAETNLGATLLAVLWVPRRHAEVPRAMSGAIAPGTSASFEGVVPDFAHAHLLEIRATPPTGGGRATLTLELDGTVRAHEDITGSKTWSSVVQ